LHFSPFSDRAAPSTDVDTLSLHDALPISSSRPVEPWSRRRPGRLPRGWAFGAVWRRGGRGGRRRGLAGPVRGVGRRGRRGLPSQRRRCGWLGGGSVRWRAGHPGSSLVLSLPTPTVVFLSDKNFSRPLPFPATPCYV